MILCVCIDDRGGMLFNHRRQSRDRVQVEDMLALSAGRPLYCAPYSLELLEGMDEVKAAENFLEIAGEGDICFVEDRQVSPYADKIEVLYIYRWNRTYPRDLLFHMPDGLRLTESREFAGYSHEKITRERYER